MCAAPFSCVGDPRSALLGSVQFLFWFRLISPELRDVLAKRSPARGFSAAPCGSLSILTAMPSLVTNSAGTVLIPVPISPPKMDGIEQFVRWGAARLGGSCHAWGDARPDRALGCVDCYARFARRRASSGLILEVDVGEPLPVGVADDEADARFPPSTVSRQSLPVTPEVAPVALGSETLEGVRD
jgi:hypothetical protein